ncbi:MAG: T9SS type A sorting domain-containing protein [Bacteroidetes bacterium]|nr:T9SS type A sorting domain-containing protein [Bacteroidota bacterium]
MGFFPDGTSNSPPLQNPCHNFASPATYTVILKVTNSSGDVDSTYQSITIDLCAKVDESNFNENIEIYPNPTNSVLKIIDKKNQFKNSIIEIENYIGQVVFATPFANQINLADLSQGIYFLTIQNGSITKSIKFIKQ